jgi:hypothetical protein
VSAIKEHQLPPAFYVIKVWNTAGIAHLFGDMAFAFTLVPWMLHNDKAVLAVAAALTVPLFLLAFHDLSFLLSVCLPRNRMSKIRSVAFIHPVTPYLSCCILANGFTYLYSC